MGGRGGEGGNTNVHVFGREQGGVYEGRGIRIIALPPCVLQETAFDSFKVERGETKTRARAPPFFPTPSLFFCRGGGEEN